MMLLPIVLRLLAQLEGIPQRTGVELSLMSRFFIFQVIVSELTVLDQLHQFRLPNIIALFLDRLFIFGYTCRNP